MSWANLVYGAVIGHTEGELEVSGAYRGNGHHLAQRIAEMVEKAAEEKGYQLVRGHPRGQAKTPELQADFDKRAELVRKALLEIKHTWLLELSTLAHGVPRYLDIEGETNGCHRIIDQLADEMKETI